MKKKTLIATGVAALLASGMVLANGDNAVQAGKKKTNAAAMVKKADYQAACGANCSAMCGGCNAAAGCGACGGAATCGADACGGACGGCSGASSY